MGCRNRKRATRRSLGGHHAERLRPGARNNLGLAGGKQVRQIRVLEPPGEVDPGEAMGRGGEVAIARARIRSGPVAVLEPVEERAQIPKLAGRPTLELAAALGDLARLL